MKKRDITILTISLARLVKSSAFWPQVAISTFILIKKRQNGMDLVRAEKTSLLTYQFMSRFPGKYRIDYDQLTHITTRLTMTN